jgi:hypothetical protein
MTIIIDGQPVEFTKVEGVLRYSPKSGTYTLQFELPKSKTLQKELGYPKQDTPVWLAIPNEHPSS